MPSNGLHSIIFRELCWHIMFLIASLQNFTSQPLHPPPPHTLLHPLSSPSQAHPLACFSLCCSLWLSLHQCLKYLLTWILTLHVDKALHLDAKSPLDLIPLPAVTPPCSFLLANSTKERSPSPPNPPQPLSPQRMTSLFKSESLSASSLRRHTTACRLHCRTL